MGGKYIEHPTHVRVFQDENTTKDWCIDGVNGSGQFTEECWRFTTWQEAMDAVPEFVKAQRNVGVIFHWRPQEFEARHWANPRSFPAKFCWHPYCRDTNWGGRDRTHVRGWDCPPPK